MKAVLAAAFLGLAFVPAARAQSAMLERSPAPQEMVVLRVNSGSTPYDESVDVSMSGNRITAIFKAADITNEPPPPPAGGYVSRVQLGKFPAGDYQVDVMTRRANALNLVTSIPLHVGTSGSSVQPVADNTDLWWNPQESGWGLNIVQHGAGPIFATWFAYGADGSAQWYVIPGGQWTSPVRFTGSIYRTNGPDIAAPFDPSKVTRTLVGGAAMTFTDGGLQAILTVDGQTTTKFLQRQSF